MANKKLLKIRLSATYLIAIIIGIVAIVGGVVAYSNQAVNPPTTVIENAGGVTINNPVSPIPEEEPSMGALTSPNIESDYLCVNSDCVYYLSMPFIDASTTIASFTDPFLTATSSYTPNSPILAGDQVFGYVGATSTVEMIVSTITSPATTTFELDCTASNTAYTTSTPALLNTETRVATSTIGVIRSGMTSSTNAGMGSLVYDANLATVPVTAITLTPQKPYLVCRVWQPYGTSLDAFTSAVNTFDGAANAVIRRQRY